MPGLLATQGDGCMPGSREGNFEPPAVPKGHGTPVSSGSGGGLLRMTRWAALPSVPVPSLSTVLTGSGFRLGPLTAQLRGIQPGGGRFLVLPGGLQPPLLKCHAVGHRGTADPAGLTGIQETESTGHKIQTRGLRGC